MPKKHIKEDEILDTLTGLTEAVGSGFDKMNSRLDRVDETLTHHDQQLSHIDGRLGAIDNRLDIMQSQLERIEHSILEEHARRIEALERKVGLAQ